MMAAGAVAPAAAAPPWVSWINDVLPLTEILTGWRTILIGGPEGSVPVTGAEAPLTDFVATLNSDNPIPFESASVEAGRDLFVTNCSMCHGQNADGESYVASKFKQYQTKPPPSLRLQGVADKTDGALFWTISKGVGNMPSFTPLLTAEERWSLVNYIRSLQP